MSSNNNNNTITSPVEYLSRILAPSVPPILASVSRGSSLGITPKADYRLYDSNQSEEQSPFPTQINNHNRVLYSPPLINHSTSTSILRAPSIHDFVLGDNVPDTNLPDIQTMNNLHNHHYHTNTSPTTLTSPSLLFRSPRPSSLNLGTTTLSSNNYPSSIIHHSRSVSNASAYLSNNNLPILTTPALSTTTLPPLPSSLSSTTTHHDHALTTSSSALASTHLGTIPTNISPMNTTITTTLLPPSSLTTISTAATIPLKKNLFSPKLINFLKWGNKDYDNEIMIQKRAIILHALQTPVMIPPLLQNRMPGIITYPPFTSIINSSNSTTPTMNESSKITSSPSLPNINSNNDKANNNNNELVIPSRSLVLWNRPRSHSFSGTTLREDNLINQYQEGIELKKLILAITKIRTKQEAKLSTLLSLLFFECVSIIA